jgi:hypothetical protein
VPRSKPYPTWYKQLEWHQQCLCPPSGLIYWRQTRVWLLRNRVAPWLRDLPHQATKRERGRGVAWSRAGKDGSFSRRRPLSSDVIPL